MDNTSAKKIRVFRGEEKILSILNDYSQSKLSIKAFCEDNHIASATFHNWKKKYSTGSKKPAKRQGFAALNIVGSPAVETGLFAEVRE